EKAPREGEVTREICPAAPGAKDWQPSAYSPDTGYLYIPHQNLCMDMRVSEVRYIAGTPFVGAEVAMYGGPGEHRGEYTAWDPVAREEVWTIEEESRSGAAPSRRQAGLRSTERWTAGSRRSTPRPATCFGSSASSPESSGNRSRTWGRTAGSTSRSRRASAAGRARSSPADSIRTCRSARSASSARRRTCRT